MKEPLKIPLKEPGEVAKAPLEAEARRAKLAAAVGQGLGFRGLGVEEIWALGFRELGFRGLGLSGFRELGFRGLGA